MRALIVTSDRFEDTPTSAFQMPEEIELKLTLDPHDVPLLRNSSILKRLGSGGEIRKRIITTYYDTSSMSLLRNRISLRVRKIGHDHLQSIKIDRPNDHFPAQRAETENPLATDRPDLEIIEDPALRRLIEKSRNGKRLRPVFSTDVVREIRPLKFAGNEIECALDRGVVAARGKKAPICEVEFELQSGQPSSLLRLARRLNADIPLRLEAASKAARGYMLLSGARPTAPRATPIHLDASMNARECLKTIMDLCTAHVVASAEYATNSEDPEGIHQLRVAIRRTRAAFSIIRRHVAEGLNFRVADDLRSLQGSLGGAREWDVLVNETLARAPKRLLSEPLSVHLEDTVEAKRAEAHKQAHAALRDRRCTDLLLRLTHWVDAELGSPRKERSPDGTRGSDPLVASASEFAATVIEDCDRKAHKLGRKIRTLEPANLHRLRIRAKKLRYAAEFFGSLWPDRTTKKHLSALKDLQQALGTYHDTTVATDLVASLGATGKGYQACRRPHRRLAVAPTEAPAQGSDLSVETVPNAEAVLVIRMRFAVGAAAVC
jgi:triphosphatase